MDAREYLEQVGKIDRLIENKLIEKEQWRSIALGTSASGSDGDRVQSSGSKEKMADAVIKIIEIEEEIDELVDKLVDTKQDVIRTIERLDSISYDILHKRYIQGKDLYEICDLYGRPVPSIKRKQGKALKQVQTLLNERENNEKE